jgi:hypothetical protein
MVKKANDSQLQRCAFLVALLLTSSAHAVDGVIEINQARALAGGVTPGDGPGFPVSINAPGSYRLTSNLSMTGNTNAIVDSLAEPVDDVTIDLNGFTIDGKGSTTNGIQLSGGNNWEIRSGTVKGFANGIQQQVSSTGHRVIGVRVLDNSKTGIAIANGEGHLIRDCTAIGNGTGNLDRGLLIGANSTVIGNTVMNNSGNGMSLGAGVGYGNNVVNSNGGTIAGGVEMGTNVCDGNTTCP